MITLSLQENHLTDYAFALWPFNSKCLRPGKVTPQPYLKRGLFKGGYLGLRVILVARAEPDRQGLVLTGRGSLVISWLIS